MTKFVNVTPAYGRDYRSAKRAREDWRMGKDFILQDLFSPWDGKPINKEQADKEGYIVTIRFDRGRKVCQAED